jgi:hypothetical protein
MRNSLLILFLLNFGILLSGCNDVENTAFSETGAVTTSSEELPPVRYKKEVESLGNGLKTEKKIGDFTFSAQFLPYELVVCNELKKDALTKEEVAARIKEINQLQYFTFRIKAENSNIELLKTGINSGGEYNDRVEYCSFKMQKDFNLIDGGDTLDCVLFHYERIYGVAPYGTFSLGFPISKKEAAFRETHKEYNLSNKSIIYDDKVFGNGKIYLTIESKKLNRIPKLKTL